MRPRVVQALMRDVLDLCQENNRINQPVVFHTLSVGGYMYGEVLVNIRNHPEKYGDFGQRIHGQIFDSVIDFYGIPRGVANASTRNEKHRAQIKRLVEWYMNTFKAATTSYVRASQAFHDNDFRTPSLFIYSHGDPVSHPDHYETLAQTWREANIAADTLHWTDAPHVSTFKMYPKKYSDQVIEFLQKTGIQGINFD